MKTYNNNNNNNNNNKRNKTVDNLALGITY
jgi:hypothetical protein